MDTETANVNDLRSWPNRVFRAGSPCLCWTGLALFLLAACGGSGPSGQHASSPSPDQMTQHYVALVHSYWIAYKSAEGDVPTFARVCWGQLTLSSSAEHNPANVDPVACREIADAIILPHEAFVRDLDSTPAPSRFKSDDAVFRTRVTTAIKDLTAMASSASAGDRVSVIQYMTNYVNDMVPKVLTALDDVDPTVVHT
jgi:hypothetical protein